MTPPLAGTPLSARELEVARLVAQGLRSRQIAAQLDISVRTVEGHLQSIYGKTGARSRIKLINWLAGSGASITGNRPARDLAPRS